MYFAGRSSLKSAVCLRLITEKVKSAILSLRGDIRGTISSGPAPLLTFWFLALTAAFGLISVCEKHGWLWLLTGVSGVSGTINSTGKNGFVANSSLFLDVFSSAPSVLHSFLFTAVLDDSRLSHFTFFTSVCASWRFFRFWPDFETSSTTLTCSVDFSFFDFDGLGEEIMQSTSLADLDGDLTGEKKHLIVFPARAIIMIWKSIVKVSIGVRLLPLLGISFVEHLSPRLFKSEEESSNSIFPAVSGGEFTGEK